MSRARVKPDVCGGGPEGLEGLVVTDPCLIQVVWYIVIN